MGVFARRCHGSADLTTCAIRCAHSRSRRTLPERAKEHWASGHSPRPHRVVNRRTCRLADSSCTASSWAPVIACSRRTGSATARRTRLRRCISTHRVRRCSCVRRPTQQRVMSPRCNSAAIRGSPPMIHAGRSRDRTRRFAWRAAASIGSRARFGSAVTASRKPDDRTHLASTRSIRWLTSKPTSRPRIRARSRSPTARPHRGMVRWPSRISGTSRGGSASCTVHASKAACSAKSRP